MLAVAVTDELGVGIGVAVAHVDMLAEVGVVDVVEVVVVGILLGDVLHRVEVVVDAHILAARLELSDKRRAAGCEVEQVADASIHVEGELVEGLLRGLGDLGAGVPLGEELGKVGVVVEYTVALAEVVAAIGKLGGVGDAVEPLVLVGLALFVEPVLLRPLGVGHRVVVVPVRVGVGRGVVSRLLGVGEAVSADILVGLPEVLHDRLSGVTNAVAVEVDSPGEGHRTVLVAGAVVESFVGLIGLPVAVEVAGAREGQGAVFAAHAVAELDHGAAAIGVELVVVEARGNRKARSGASGAFGVARATVGVGAGELTERKAGRREGALVVVGHDAAVGHHQVGKDVGIIAAREGAARAVSGVIPPLVEPLRVLELHRGLVRGAFAEGRRRTESTHACIADVMGQVGPVRGATKRPQDVEGIGVAVADHRGPVGAHRHTGDRAELPVAVVGRSGRVGEANLELAEQLGLEPHIVPDQVLLQVDDERLNGLGRTRLAVVDADGGGARASRQQRCLNGDRHEVAATEPAGVGGQGEGRRHRGVALGNNAPLGTGERHIGCSRYLVALKLRRESDGASAHRDLEEQGRAGGHGRRHGRTCTGERSADSVRPGVGTGIGGATGVARTARVAGALDAHVGRRALLVVAAAGEGRQAEPDRQCCNLQAAAPLRLLIHPEPRWMVAAESAARLG